MKTEIPRRITDLTVEYMQYFPVVFIEGARQVGKSTLTRQLLADDSQAVFVNLDNDQTLAVAQKSPGEFVEQSATTLVIDEIQRLPRLTLSIKNSLESDRRPGRFLATGSVDVLRVPANPESLAGRSVSVRLRGLSQGEVHGGHDDFVAMLTEMNNPFTVTSSLSREDYATKIARGGFPELLNNPQKIRTAWFKSYLTSILEKDAGIFERGVQPARLRSVLNLIAANQANELVYARIANDLDIPMPSVKDTVIALENVFLIDRISAWSPNLTKREISRPKVVVSDSGLAAHLMGSKEESLKQLTSQTFGPLLEGFVAGELLKQQSWAAESFELLHYRDRAGTEVDFVLQLNSGEIIGIEVKSTSEVRPHHFKSLEKLRDRVGSAWRMGVVLHTGAQGMPFGDRLCALPVSALWE